MLVATLLASCGGTETTLWTVPPPPTPGARSILFALSSERGPILFASPATQDHLQWSIDPEEAAGLGEITALAYGEDLDTLRLREGRLRPIDVASCALEAPIGAHRTSVTEAPGRAWAPAPRALDDRLRGALFSSGACVAPDRCAVFSATYLPLAHPAGTRVMIRVDDRLLLADTVGRFYTATATAVVRAPELDGRPARALALGPDGAVWFGGVGGRVDRGPLGGPYTALDVQTASTAAVVAIGVSPEGEALAVVLNRSELTEDRWVEVHHRRDGAWARLFRHAAPVRSWWESDVAWLDAGHAVLTFGGPLVLRFDGDRIDATDLRNLDYIDHIAGAALAVGPDLAYVGGRFGALIAAERPFDSWAPVATPIPNTIQSLAAYAGGVVVGGTSGYIGQYYPGGQPCDGNQYGQGDAHLLEALGPHLFVGANDPDGSGPNRLLRLTPLSD